MRSALLALFISCATVTAVEPMPRPDETAAVWTSQAAASTDAAMDLPSVSGSYLWSGRADRNYKPFFQWEIAVADRGVSDLRIRVIPLAADLSDITVGAWKRLPGADDDGIRSISYKLPTVIPALYRVELRWAGGERSFLAPDRRSLPVPTDILAGKPQLLAVEPTWERNKRGQAIIEFWLRNAGDTAATGISTTVEFISAEGKVLGSTEHTPKETELDAGGAALQTLKLKQTPEFTALRIKTSCAEDRTMSFSADGLGSDASVSVGEVATAEGMISGKVRNGLSEPVQQVIVTVSLSSGSTVVSSIEHSIDAIEAGTVVDWTVEIPADAPAWDGLATDLTFATAAEPVADSGAVVITADALAFTVQDSAGADGWLKVRGELANTGSATLPGLVCSFVVPGADAPAEITIGDLEAGATFSMSFSVSGVDQLTGLGLSYTTTVTTTTP